MKTIFIFSLILFSTHISFSQSYESLFGTQSTQWRMTIGNLWGTGSTEHKVVADTIIEGQTYKVIDGYDNAIGGFLRQDSSHQKAWYRSLTYDDEILVMDLDLEIGDSLYIGGGWNNYPDYYRVDSIYIKDDRKHIQFDYPIYFMDDEKFTLIEGVVSNLGFRYQDNEWLNVYPTILLCAFQNDERIYGEDECLFSSINDIKTTATISIFPNPVIDNLTIYSESEIPNGKITIINPRGIINYEMTGHISNQQTINLNHLKNGLYFLILYDYDKGTIQTKEILKAK